MPLSRRHPARLGLARLGVPPVGTPAAPGARRIGDTGGREVGQDHRGLLGIGRGKHDTDPVTQVVQVQPTRGLVLAQQRD
jgi:hypothetical protein